MRFSHLPESCAPGALLTLPTHCMPLYEPQGAPAWWVHPGEDAKDSGCCEAEVESYDGGDTVTLKGLSGWASGKTQTFPADAGPIDPDKDPSYACERDINYPEGVSFSLVLSLATVGRS